MFGDKKERERYYLLPGMGGRSLKRKRKLMLIWGVAMGLVVSVLLAMGLYYLGRR